MPFDGLSITSPTIEVLRRGRALIEECGLCKGTFKDNHGRYCTAGAITFPSAAPTYSEAIKHAEVRRSIDKALTYLTLALPNNYMTIACWNDKPERTTADVLALYDRAIDLAIADAM